MGKAGWQVQLVNQRAFHIQRPLVCVACCFGLGIWLGGSGETLNLPLMAAGLVCAILLTGILPLCRRPLIAGICFVALFGGMLYASMRANPALPPEGKYTVRAVVSGEAERRLEDGRIKALLRQVELVDEQGKIYYSSGAYWTYYPDPASPLPLDGQSLSMNSTLYHPDGQVNPYGFDFQLYLMQKDIPVGLSGGRDIVWTPQVQLEPSDPWLKAKLAIGSLLDKVLGQDSALFKALLIGERSQLEDDTTQAFRDAGIAHVLAVSGLHVGILVGMLLTLLKWLRVRSWTRMIVIAIFLLLYARLLDFAAPVLRAAILSMVIMTGQMLHKRSDPLTNLALAFMIILSFRPLDIFQAGFQLSFLAVLGIFVLGDKLRYIYSKSRSTWHKHKLLDWTVLAFITTLAASAFTTPITMTAFHQFSLIGLLWSPIACLIVAWLMVGGLVLIALAALSMPLAQAVAVPFAFLSRLFSDISKALADLPFAVYQTAALSAALSLAVFLTLWLLTRYVLVRRYQRVMIASAALIISLSLGFATRQPYVRYIQFSAGSADAALIEDGNVTIGIDTGENGSDLAAYLLSSGRSLETLYITHLHSDHIGGLQQLLESGVQIQRIVLPFGAMETQVADNSSAILQMARDAGIFISYVGAGDTWQQGRINMRVLWPYEDRMYPGLDANLSSLTMLWDLDGSSLMTTADLSSDYELYAAQPAQILKLAHHGSKSSSSMAFLQIVMPQIALLTTSDSLQEHASETLERLDAFDCQVYGTNKSGALILTAAPHGLIIEEYAKRGTR